ncbi:MAG: hypothetical protein JO250_15555 [Armatimonadetes bacterium]|nr:hypothetical protein [Armatimonadota bacterium]
MPCPSNPKRFYAYVDVGGTVRSDDGGRTWTMLHGHLPARLSNYEVRGLTVDPRDANKVLIATGSQWSAPEGIYASDDAGRTWRKTLTAQFAGNGEDRWTGFLLTRSSRNPNIVVVASEGTGVYKSVDDGKTWRALGMTGLHLTDLRFDRTNPRRLWLCARPLRGWMGGKMTTLVGGFYRSEDGGVTWKKVLDNSPSEILQDPKEANRIYGIVENRVQISDDGGASWRDGSDGLPARAAGETGNSESSFQALAAGPDFVLTASTKGTFYRMPSGGTHWQRIERQGLTELYYGHPWFGAGTGRFGQALGSITVDPHDSARWFFTDWFSIYRTEDAGRHWSLSDDGLETTVIHTITQDPSDPGRVHLGMADNGYFLSENGGVRFALGQGISNNVKCISVCPSLPARVYAVGPRTWEWEANQVFVSIDAGRTWTRSPMTGLPDMTQHHCNTIAADPRDPYTVYLAVSQSVGPTSGGVYKSTDGGKSWTWMGDGLPAGQAFFTHDIWVVGREIAAAPDGALVAISRDHGQVFRWDAANNRWAAVSLALHGGPNDLAAGRTGFFLAVGGDGVYRSADGGRIWAKVWSGDASHLAVDVAHPDRVAAGTSDGVILSRDAGRTWTPLNRSLPYRIGNTVAFAGDRLLAGSGGSGAFWMPLTPTGAKVVIARTR